MQATPYIDFGGTGETILFLHANGFPPKTYQKLINQLITKYHVIAFEQRPLWPNSDPNELKSYDLFTDDLIHFIQMNMIGPVKCIGHSLGAMVSVLASKRRPDLFKHLVLIEPVLFSKLIPFFVNIFPPSIGRNIVPISRIALKRRSKWNSQAEMYSSYREKKIFSLISNDALDDLVKAATYEDDNGDIRLRFPKVWEAQIYATIIYILDKVLDNPTTISIARGEFTDVISNKIWTKLKATFPENNLINVTKTTHLLPLEKPELVGKWIIDQLQ